MLMSRECKFDAWNEDVDVDDNKSRMSRMKQDFGRTRVFNIHSKHARRMQSEPGL